MACLCRVCSKMGGMRFDIVTIFPEFFGGPLDYGIVRRAREARLIPGVLGNEDSAVNESFSEHPLPPPAEDASFRTRQTNRGILDCPHYTRPQLFRGWDVPDILMSGNHEEIRRWRARKALEKTLRNRPELLEGR